ncbi:MAG TPA: GWxTD domain-containing protein [Longimicrobiales bacterium]|nr:GWxTD domain-containing protein [Longimicrobiales bacterium]
MRVLIAPLLLILLLPLPAAAQDFRALRDSLSGIRDTIALRAALPRRADRNDAAALLRAGLVELRLYELTARRERARRARSHFGRAQEVAPGQAWAHYGWALAMLPEIDRPVRATEIVTLDALNEVLGVDPRSRARRALERAVRLDPGLTDAAALLARLAEETRDRDATVQARTVLERQFAARGDAVAGLGLARAATALGDHEAAAAAARQVAATDPEHAAEAHRAAALALFHLPDRAADAVAEYYAGVTGWDDVLAQLYYRDIELLVSDREELLWVSADLAGRRAWLREFWQLRAALGGVSAAQRIVEHYRRIADADRFFRRATRYGAPPGNALSYEPFHDRYDDRGVIYIRHGAPREVVRSVDRAPRTSRLGRGLPSFDPEESWVYLDDRGRPVMYNFKRYGSEGYDSWLLLYLVPCGRDFVEPRLAFAPQLFKLMTRCDPSDRRTLSQPFRKSAYEALRTDSHRPAFLIDVPFHYDVFTFRGTSGSTDVVTALSVAGERLSAQRLADGGAEYALNLRVAVVDTAARTSARRDTVLRLLTSAPLQGDQRLRAHLALSVPPTPAAIHRTVVHDAADPARGQVYGTPLVVPDYFTGTLAMSDVVLAAPDSAGAFQRGAVSLSLVPWAAYRGGAFRVFYELYELTPGGSYTTELRVERAGGGLSRLFRSSTLIRLRFDEVAPDAGGPVQHVRDVQVELDPGEYRLRLRITDQASGTSIERERRLTIAKP